MSAAAVDHEADRKARETRCAKAALVGATLVQTDADDGRPLLVLSRWGLTRSFSADELDELDRTLQAMGAPAG